MGKRKNAVRPAPPDGHVYLADVLDVVRKHAAANSWCGETEEFIRETFDLNTDDLPDQSDRGYCCFSCDGNRDTYLKRHGETQPRITLANPLRTVHVSALKDAVRKGIGEYADGDGDDYRAMFRDVIDTFGLPVEIPS